ncbi:hypothetical protein [Novosphingobium umbonatum]|uniref:hypothetical protein n=1 Tax=Novosphingobium umbonatum TaxID=1908524 RepID=UPI0013E2DBCD|nr:hypothetical protein [Novosphingobium umbonatum]
MTKEETAEVRSVLHFARAADIPVCIGVDYIRRRLRRGWLLADAVAALDSWAENRLSRS